MTTEQELINANKNFPNSEAYKILAGPNLTMPQFLSGNRANMFCSHVEQHVPLINPESPALATSFEKPYGKYTDSYEVAKSDMKIIAVIPKYVNVSRFNYIYIVQNLVTKVYDVIEIKHYECLSENRGYLRPYTTGDTYKPGDIIKKGETLFRSNNHDEFGNYRYGKNANVAYVSIPEVEEDGIVIRKGFCEEFAFYDVFKIPCILNKNHILLNYYGDDKNYKCFPDIGEEVKDGILYARRTINYQNAAAELTDNSLRHIVTSDEVCRGAGVVGDIDIWINDKEEFIDSENKRQIYNYYQQLLAYYTKIYNILDPIVNAKQNSGIQYTYKLRWQYEHARNYLDQNVQWQNNNNSFEFAYIVITTYEKKIVGNGYKLTDRFGGKGVISHVWPDEYMPRDEYGNVADLIISPPSTPARTNPGRNYEQEYNFIAEEIRKRISKLPLDKKVQLYIEFITDVNPKEGEAARVLLSKKNQFQLEKAFEDIDKNGMILIHEPFGGTVSLENIEYLYTKYKIKPGFITMCREFKDTTTKLPLENQSSFVIDVDHDTGKEYLGEKSLNSRQLGNVEGLSPFDIKKGEDYVDLNYSLAPNTDGSISKIRRDYKPLRVNTINGVKEVSAYINSEGLLVRRYTSMNRVVIGKQYYMLLKQMPDEKFSARSIGSTNQIGVPNKPGKQTKQMAPYAKSAIRQGEMENDCNFIRVPNEIVHRYMSTCSQNPELREKLAKMLLTEDPFEMHDLPIEDEDIKDDITALMFHSTLYSIGIEINPIYAEQ